MSPLPPHFGDFDPAVSYVLRPGAYALALQPGRGLLIVETVEGLELPGGGVEPGESPEAALLRELGEETGHVLRACRPLFSARQFRNQPRDGKFHDKRCTFFLARLGPLAGPPQEAGHTPRWVAPDSVIGRMVEPCHDWAIATLLAR